MRSRRRRRCRCRRSCRRWSRELGLIDAATEGRRYQHAVPGQDLKPAHDGARQAFPERRPVHSKVGREKNTSCGACIQCWRPKPPIDRQRHYQQVCGDPAIETCPGQPSVIGHPDASLDCTTDRNSLSTRLTSFARCHLDEDVIPMSRVDHDLQRLVARRDR